MVESSVGLGTIISLSDNEMNESIDHYAVGTRE